MSYYIGGNSRLIKVLNYAIQPPAHCSHQIFKFIVKRKYVANHDFFSTSGSRLLNRITEENITEKQSSTPKTTDLQHSKIDLQKFLKDEENIESPFKEIYNKVSSSVRRELSTSSDSHVRLNKLLSFHPSKINPIIYINYYLPIKNNISEEMVDKLIEKLIFHHEFSAVISLAVTHSTFGDLHDRFIKITKSLIDSRDSYHGIIDLVRAIEEKEESLRTHQFIEAILQEAKVSISREDIYNIIDNQAVIECINDIDTLRDYISSNFNGNLLNAQLHLRVKLYAKAFELSQDKSKTIANLFKDTELLQIEGSFARIIMHVPYNQKVHFTTFNYLRQELLSINLNSSDFRSIYHSCAVKDFCKIVVFYGQCLKNGKLELEQYIIEELYHKLKFDKEGRSWKKFLHRYHQLLDAVSIGFMMNRYFLHGSKGVYNSFESYLEYFQKYSDESKRSEIVYHTLRIYISGPEAKIDGVVDFLNCCFKKEYQISNNMFTMAVDFLHNQKAISKVQLNRLVDLKLNYNQLLRLSSYIFQSETVDTDIFNKYFTKVICEITTKETNVDNSRISEKSNLPKENIILSTLQYHKLSKLCKSLSGAIVETAPLSEIAKLLNSARIIINNDFIYNKLAGSFVFKMIEIDDFLSARELIEQLEKPTTYLRGLIIERLIARDPFHSLVMVRTFDKDDKVKTKFLSSAIIGTLTSTKIGESKKVHIVARLIREIRARNSHVGVRPVVHLVNTILDGFTNRKGGSKERLRWALNTAKIEGVPDHFFLVWFSKLRKSKNYNRKF